MKNQVQDQEPFPMHLDLDLIALLCMAMARYDEHPRTPYQILVLSFSTTATRKTDVPIELCDQALEEQDEDGEEAGRRDKC